MYIYDCFFHNSHHYSLLSLHGAEWSCHCPRTANHHIYSPLRSYLHHSSSSHRLLCTCVMYSLFWCDVIWQWCECEGIYEQHCCCQPQSHWNLQLLSKLTIHCPLMAVTSTRLLPCSKSPKMSKSRLSETQKNASNVWLLTRIRWNGSVLSDKNTTWALP